MISILESEIWTVKAGGGGSGTAPDEAPDISISSIKSTSFIINTSWVTNASSYDYEYSLDQSAWTASNSVKALEKLIESLTVYTVYYVRVRGRNETGPGPYSDISSLRTLSVPNGHTVSVEMFEQRIERPSIEFLRFAWSIKPTIEDLNSITFGIMRSNSPEGPFDLIKEQKNQFFFEDWDVNQHSENRTFYYRLRITEDVTENYKDYDPISLQVDPDPIALDMVRKKLVALNNGSTPAVDIKIFIRKTFGTYCQNCFDPIKKRKIESNCVKCFNTNFEGGYFTPIDARAFFNVSQKSIQNVGFEIHPDAQFIEMVNYPILSPGDIIRHPESRNYKVDSVKTTRRGTFVISQFAQLTEVNHNDIEFELT